MRLIDFLDVFDFNVNPYVTKSDPQIIRIQMQDYYSYIDIGIHSAIDKEMDLGLFLNKKLLNSEIAYIDTFNDKMTITLV